MKVINPKAPQLKGQPKTHKTDIPIRPIVNFRTAPTYKICKYLNRTIKSNLNWESNFSILNTTELVNNIKNINIPDNSYFISFDIKDMYSNIPPRETLTILEQDLRNSNNLNNQQIRDIIQLTKTCINQNYFEFNSHFYQQENGLAMGSPLSGLLSDIFMHNLEDNNIINDSNPFRNKIIYWYRYVDDIICLFNGTKEESENFLTYLNSLSMNIQFTSENNSTNINYLDVTISNENNQHIFKIYRKPTQSDLLIPSKSNHPWKYKMAGFRAMINRLLNIPMNENNYIQEIKIIKYLAMRNGYNPKIIDRMIKNIKKKRNQTTRPKENSDQKKFIKVPYTTKMNKAIRKTFGQTKYQLSYSTRNNTFEIINKLSKEESTLFNKYNKSGIYRIKCSDCEKFYIGQTGRTFKSRFNEHIQALRSQNKTSMKSNYAEHLLNQNHNFKNIEENLEIIEFMNKSTKMDSKEELYIYLSFKKEPQNLINLQINQDNPILEKIRKIKEN